MMQTTELRYRSDYLSIETRSRDSYEPRRDLFQGCGRNCTISATLVERFVLPCKQRGQLSPRRTCDRHIPPANDIGGGESKADRIAVRMNFGFVYTRKFTITTSQQRGRESAPSPIENRDFARPVFGDEIVIIFEFIQNNSVSDILHLIQPPTRNSHLAKKAFCLFHPLNFLHHGRKLNTSHRYSLPFLGFV